MDYLVTRGDFLRTDLKFLLEGDSYSVCNRCFGNIQNVFNAQEKIETPQDWETIIVTSVLSSIKVCWVGLDMIKDYKSFLKLKYISENEDLQHEKFKVKKIAWINFGIGEQPDDRGNLKVSSWLCLHAFYYWPKTATQSGSVSKKRQATPLWIELLTTLRQELRPIPEDVKQQSLKLARKYLSECAEHYYAALLCIQEGSEINNWRLLYTFYLNTNCVLPSSLTQHLSVLCLAFVLK